MVSCLSAAQSDTETTLEINLMLVLFQIGKADRMQSPLNLVKMLAIIALTLKTQMYSIHDAM